MLKGVYSTKSLLCKLEFNCVFLQPPHRTVRYSMVSTIADSLTYFYIDENTGIIYVRSPLYEDTTDRMTYEVWGSEVFYIVS